MVIFNELRLKKKVTRKIECIKRMEFVKENGLGEYTTNVAKESYFLLS